MVVVVEVKLGRCWGESAVLVLFVGCSIDQETMAIGGIDPVLLSALQTY